jgi:hypothetical protein
LGSVATKSLGGRAAQTAAFIVAQVKAVFFNSAISSLAVGLRSRLNESMKLVPDH